MTGTSSFTFLLLLLTIRGSIQRSTQESLTYRAAVVEASSIEYRNDSAKMLDKNADKMIAYIRQAAERDVDIVVFPEMGLPSLTLGTREGLVSRSTLVPEPSQNYAPCRNSSIPVQEALKKIACAVEENKIYVVINILEKETCSGGDCHSDGLFVYISNVVFDRNGRIIARSRKNHLVDEYDLIDVTKEPEPSIFHTDFGVTFSSTVCFDIMYEEAWLPLSSLNITDVVHSSGWDIRMPFLNSIQMAAGWAYAKDVNLLYSGYNNMEWGNSGSAIYAGREGVLTAIQPLDHHNEMLVADVKKKHKRSMSMPSIRQMGNNEDENHTRVENGVDRITWKYEEFHGYDSELIAKNGYKVHTLAQKGIHCEFKVNITNLTPQGVTYRLMAFDGTCRFGSKTRLGAKLCAIVLCADNTIESCGHTTNTSGTFDFINITATHMDNPKTTMMPNTLGANMLPFKNWTWNQYKQGERIHTSMSLNTPSQDIVTFAIWGRNFEKDTR